MYRITVLPENRVIFAQPGQNLMDLLRRSGLSPDAPCGGHGTCGKCRVTANGQSVLACQTAVTEDMTVLLPETGSNNILSSGISGDTAHHIAQEGFLLAFDLGTTTVVGYLLDGQTGQELSCASARNPQSVYGADVISRIQYALKNDMKELTDSVRQCIGKLTDTLCEKAGITPAQITAVSLVGNPAMEQIFLGISPENLAKIPFAPVLTQPQVFCGREIIGLWANAKLLIAPNISGYVGGDTVACMLATDMAQQTKISLLVDIGTNGEMVLGNRDRMVACSTAAGPALEGANILFGMRGQNGAIDHVWLKNGVFCCSTIGNIEATGICGSGLIDAVSAALDAGCMNSRGKILTPDGKIHLTESIYLTQEDIRQVQLAKGAIAAGIRLLCDHFGMDITDIQQVYLAGAFGNFMNPASACRIGLLPKELEQKITLVGNAAGSGAKQMVCDPGVFAHTGHLVTQTEFLELAAVPEFPRCFAKSMRF